MNDEGLTEQQRKWMASVRASLPEKTGRPMAEWVEIARTCPETAPRARQRWFKEHHGLGVNYFSFVEHELRAASGDDARDPAKLAHGLWRRPEDAAVLAAIQAALAELPEVVTGQRKGFTTFSRRFAFAAARPAKGAVRLGLALAPGKGAPAAAANEGWSERLASTRVLTAPGEVDDAVKALLRAAWERS